MVSIPSNGSIQFLQTKNSGISSLRQKSQSPQTGQFNSYRIIRHPRENTSLSLNPLKRVNSILTKLGINPLPALRKSQSPQTGQFNSYGFLLHEHKRRGKSLNPLKRVNSILTLTCKIVKVCSWKESQSPQTGQFNSYRE